MATTTRPKNGHSSGIYEDPDRNLPPHNLDAEMSVLGSLLIDPDRFPELKLHPRMFFKGFHKKVFKVIEELHESKSAIDAITVGDRLNEDDLPKLIELVSYVPTSQNILSYEKLVKAYHLRREAIQFAGQLANRAYDDETTIDEMFAYGQEHIRKLAGDGIDEDAISFKEATSKLYDRLTERRENKEAFNEHFLKLGFLDLDRLLGGVEPGSVITLAGRPAMGKSLLEQAIRLNVARSGKRVLAINLEMTEEQLMIRATASTAKTSYKSVQNPYTLPKAHWNLVLKSLGELSELPIHIDTPASMSIDEFESAVYRLFADHGHFDLITVDYIQLMDGGKHAKSREQEVSQISRGIKQITKDLETVTMNLAQINRSVEHRQIKMPQLADLRESGSIEQDSDIVIFIYRDDYYHEDSERPNIATLSCQKNRNGSTGEVDLYFSGQKMIFRDLAREQIKI